MSNGRPSAERDRGTHPARSQPTYYGSQTWKLSVFDLLTV
jgi:hypothetical protein